MRRFFKAMVLVIGSLAGLAIMGAIWLVFFSGPPIEVTTDDRGTLVDTSRLGEYFTAASVIDVLEDNGESVLRLVSSGNECSSLRWRFVAGLNQVPTEFGDRCRVAVPSSASTFTLEAGKRYRFTIVGNNGFGHSRRSSRVFRVAVPRGVSSNQRVNTPVRPVTALVNCASAASSHG